MQNPTLKHREKINPHSQLPCPQLTVLVPILRLDDERSLEGVGVLLQERLVLLPPEPRGLVVHVLHPGNRQLQHNNTKELFLWFAFSSTQFLQTIAVLSGHLKGRFTN